MKLPSLSHISKWGPYLDLLLLFKSVFIICYMLLFDLFLLFICCSHFLNFIAIFGVVKLYYCNAFASSDARLMSCLFAFESIFSYFYFFFIWTSTYIHLHYIIHYLFWRKINFAFIFSCENLIFDCVILKLIPINGRIECVELCWLPYEFLE